MAEPRTLLSTALPPTVQIDSPPPGPPNTLELSAIGKNDNMEQDGIFTISGQLHTVATTPSDLNETVMTNDSQSEFVTTTDIHERQREQLREAGFDPDEFEEGRDCGYGKCRPDCMQTCANIKMFIFVMCILSLFSGSISAGYFNSVITTVEKRFEIGSSLSGVIAASFEFGSLVAVIFVSYFGARRHIPRLVGIGGLLISLGAFMFTLPHFLAESYTIKGGFINSTEHDNICKIPTSTSLSQPGSTATLGSAAMMNCVDSESGNGIYVFILILAQVLVGVGGTPIYTLGTTYIDNHVPKDKAPSLIAFIYATSALGPVVGFGLGALLLQYYVDAFSYDYRTLNLTTEDPRWVGAWWGGFLLFGSVLILIAIPFFGFPKTLHADLEAKILKDKGKTESEVGEPKDDEYGKTIKDIPRAVCSLLRNAIYLLTCFGVCCELAIVSGFLTFLAKYIEHQFSINKSQANLFTGGIAIPGAVLGVLLGGFLMRKLQLKPKGAIQMTLILNGLAIGVMVLLLFTGCENRKIAGATMPYSAGLDDSLEFEANLTSSCNDACSCSTRAIDLICGANDITYFSPCHAGCTHFYANNNDVVKDDSDRVLSNIKNYTDCSCIVTNSSTDIIVSQLARSGPCPHECKNFVYFMILLFGATFLTAGTQMPLLMVTMRSVAEEERSFALGMQFVIMRLLAYIPSPIMFGNLIDTTCLVWQKHCEANGSCLVYNIEQFRFKYLGIALGLKTLASLLFALVCVLIHRSIMKDLQQDMNIGDMVESMSNINTLSLDYEHRHPEEAEAERQRRYSSSTCSHPGSPVSRHRSSERKSHHKHASHESNVHHGEQSEHGGWESGLHTLPHEGRDSKQREITQNQHNDVLQGGAGHHPRQDTDSEVPSGGEKISHLRHRKKPSNGGKPYVNEGFVTEEEGAKPVPKDLTDSLAPPTTQNNFEEASFVNETNSSTKL